MTEDIRTDGTVLFLPHRLNRHPVVVRGLTANELWVCAGLSGLIGLASGITLAILLATIAISIGVRPLLAWNAASCAAFMAPPAHRAPQ